MFVLCANLCKCRGATALPVPPLLESRSGQPLFLTLQKFIGLMMENIQPIFGSKWFFPGPTVKVKMAMILSLFIVSTPEAVSMTISGLQIPGTQIGGAAG